MKIRFYAGLMAAIAMLSGKKAVFEGKSRSARPDACHMFAPPTQYGTSSLDWPSIAYARKRSRRAKGAKRG